MTISMCGLCVGLATSAATVAICAIVFALLQRR
jgi:hypothetical protein